MTITIRDVVAKPGEKVFGNIKIGEWADSSPVNLPIAVANGASEGTVVLAIGCLHGDEVVGAESIRRLFDELDPAAMSGAVIGVFAANIPAFVMGTRVNGLEDPAGSNDMKRQIRTAKADGALTDRIAAFVRDELVPHCEYYIDLHSSARGSTNYPRAIVAGDSLKADDAVRAKIDLLADACDFEYVFQPESATWKGMYFAPSYPLEEDQGKAGIVLETGFSPSMEGADVLTDGMKKIIQRVGILPGEAKRSVPLTRISRLVATRANRGGMWLPEVDVAAEVSKGDVLGRILNFRSEVLEEVVAPESGVVIKVATSATIWTGVRTHVLGVPYGG